MKDFQVHWFFKSEGGDGGCHGAGITGGRPGWPAGSEPR